MKYSCGRLLDGEENQVQENPGTRSQMNEARSNFHPTKLYEAGEGRVILRRKIKGRAAAACALQSRKTLAGEYQ